MPKLYFKYGAMGSSKTAMALMCKFNYEQKGFSVLLIKSELDNRDVDTEGNITIKSRVGLESRCVTFSPKDSIIDVFDRETLNKKIDVIIMDECQFATEKQIDDCKYLTKKVPVLCYGLKTDFKSKLFTGSKRLLEIADSIAEIKSVCRCGEKAIVNARIIDGKVVKSGNTVVIAGDTGDIKYEGMCYWCWKNRQ